MIYDEIKKLKLIDNFNIVKIHMVISKKFVSDICTYFPMKRCNINISYGDILDSKNKRQMLKDFYSLCEVCKNKKYNQTCISFNFNLWDNTINPSENTIKKALNNLIKNSDCFFEYNTSSSAQILKYYSVFPNTPQSNLSKKFKF